jgi:hypothetical protein
MDGGDTDIGEAADGAGDVEGAAPTGVDIDPERKPDAAGDAPERAARLIFLVN